MHEVGYWILHYGIVVVFASALIDRSGLPIPSFPVLLVAGALSRSGGPGAPAVIGAAALGVIIADLAWYTAATRLGGRVLGFLCRFTLSSDSCVRQTQDIFARFGAWSLLFAKFVPGLGYISVAMSGITRVRLYIFIAADSVGATLFVSLPVILGRIFHNAIDTVLARLTQLGEFGGAIVASLLLMYVAGRWIERQAFARKLRMARISVDELAGLIESGTPPIIFDVRRSDARLRDGVIPGAVAAHTEDMEKLLDAYPRDVEVVVYCSCPNETSAAIAALHLKRAGFANIRPLLGGIDAWVEAGRPIEIGA